MALGADYSWARPGGAALAAAGVKAVGRYLASDGRGITAAEYADLRAHGVGVWLVREGAAAGMLGGYAQGVADAKIAQAQIAAAGLPADSIVHTAADWDVLTSQFPACDAYHDGFASVLGGYNRVGAYGGLHWLNHVYSVGKAVSFWKAAASFWDHGETALMPLHFIQTVQPPPLPGTDHNIINDSTTLAVAGVIQIGAFMALTDQQQADLYTAVMNLAGFVYKGGPSVTSDTPGRDYDPKSLMGKAKNLENAVISVGGTSMPDDGKSLGQSVADIKTEIKEASLQTPVAVSPIIDYNQLADAIVARLPQQNVTKQDITDAFNVAFSGLVLKAAA